MNKLNENELSVLKVIFDNADNRSSSIANREISIMSGVRGDLIYKIVSRLDGTYFDKVKDGRNNIYHFSEDQYDLTSITVQDFEIEESSTFDFDGNVNGYVKHHRSYGKVFSELSLSAYKIYSMMYLYSSNAKSARYKFTASHNIISQLTGITSGSAITKAIKELEDRDLITVQPAYRASNTYIFNIKATCSKNQNQVQSQDTCKGQDVNKKKKNKKEIETSSEADNKSDITNEEGVNQREQSEVNTEECNTSSGVGDSGTTDGGGIIPVTEPGHQLQAGEPSGGIANKIEDDVPF